jgi:molybdopterin-guanine dinucleotide biosynthesis protein A
LDSSAIILAGGSSTRLRKDKGLVRLGNRPLVGHVLNAVNGLVNETILVVSSNEQAETYAKYVFPDTRVTTDLQGTQSPLVGALTGLESTREGYSLVLSCDVPFVSRGVLLLLLDLSMNHNAVIPRWPNGFIEPLQAVYRTKPAKEASRNALEAGRLDMKAMVDRLRGIRYVSTLVLQQLDPELKTFFNVNTLSDLKKAEGILKRSNPKTC